MVFYHMFINNFLKECCPFSHVFASHYLSRDVTDFETVSVFPSFTKKSISKSKVIP